MTTQNDSNDARDNVLFAFDQACERPTADQIIEWSQRYPQFADDIRAHAAVAREWDARKGAPVEKPDATMLARGYSHVLNALYNAEVAEIAAAAKSSATFQEMTAARGTDVPKLARELGIGRSVLADLFNGGMLAPVGKRLVNALTHALGVTVDAFDQALHRALNAPRIGHAKADATPQVIPRPYAEIIRTSNMTQDKIDYWLTED